MSHVFVQMNEKCEHFIPLIANFYFSLCSHVTTNLNHIDRAISTACAPGKQENNIYFAMDTVM